MSYLHHYIGLLGCMLVLVALPLVFIRQPRFSRKVVTISIFLMMGLSILPIQDLVLVAYVRGVSGDFSVTSLLLLCSAIATAYTGHSYLDQQSYKRLLNSVLVGALLLYPTALGLSGLDAYALGYGSYLLSTVLLIFCLYLLWLQDYLLLSITLIAIVGYLANVLTSTNLWDYLLDPWLVLFALWRRLQLFFVSIRRQSAAPST